jgi:hypothetical protein
LENIIGQVFRNKRIELDGHSYQKCTFVNCELYTEIGNFSLVENDFSNCSLGLGGFAQNVAVLIKMFYPDTPLWFKPETKEQVLQKMKKKLQDEGII